MRSYLRSFEAGERREALQTVLAASQNVRLKRADVEHLDDVSQPLVLHLEYVLPDTMHSLNSATSGNTLVGRIPAPWETYFLEAEYLESRETPFENTMPRLVRSSFDIHLPEGFRLTDGERLSSTGQTQFVAWASQAQDNGSTIHVEHVVRVPAGRFAAGDYPAYYAGMKDSLATLQMPLTFRSDAVVAAREPATILR